MNDYISSLSDVNLVVLITAVFLGVLQIFLLLGWVIRGVGVTLWFGIIATGLAAYLAVTTR